MADAPCVHEVETRLQIGRGVRPSFDVVVKERHPRWILRDLHKGIWVRLGRMDNTSTDERIEPIAGIIRESLRSIDLLHVLLKLLVDWLRILLQIAITFTMVQ